MPGRYHNVGYQYETSPRKLEPEIKRTQKKYPKKSTTAKTKKKENIKVSSDKKYVRRREMWMQAKTIAGIMFIFAVIFTIGYRDSLISAKFAAIQSLKKEVSEIEKQNNQLEVSIQDSLNLATIEQEAKEKLGMQKLANKQIVNVKLDKKDYVENKKEEVKIEEPSLLDSIIDKLKNIF